MATMNTIRIQITGMAPLMVHNERLANPRDPGTRELKALTAQRQKTPDVIDKIAELEWRLGLYTDESGAPALPGDNVLAALKEGARKRKLGKKVEAGVWTTAKAFPLEYDGPKEIDALFADGRFFDFRGVDVGGKRVMRARPRFDAWSVAVELAFDPEIISRDELVEALATAGEQVGLCEKRPQMGRFLIKVLDEGSTEQAA